MPGRPAHRAPRATARPDPAHRAQSGVSSQNIAAGSSPQQAAALMLRLRDAGAGQPLDEAVDAAVSAYRSSPPSCARLAVVLCAAGQPDLAKRFIEGVAANESDPVLRMLTSCLSAAGLGNLAGSAFAAAAMNRPPRSTIAYADALSRRGQRQNASTLLISVISARPALVVGMLQALRDDGRPADADRLLRQVAAAPAATCCAAARALADVAAHADANRLLASLAGRPLVELMAAIEILDDGGAEPPSPLRDRSPGEYVDAIDTLRRQGLERYFPRLIEVLGCGRADLVHATAHALLKAQFSQEAFALLEYYAVHAAVALVARLFVLLDADADATGDDGTRIVMDTVLTGRPHPAPVLVALREAGTGERVRQHLERLVPTLPADRIAALCIDLTAHGAEHEVETLLTRSAARDDWEAIQDAFCRASHHKLAYRLSDLHPDRLRWWQR
ncbi:MAG TPA: hypothetical protein VGZ32_27340 [Actinocrinis sp.]|jgi:hypothetical protein|uniref:hypothetical protein n=1 Tax=Actinocrinis sp. TaxID=1920516 RepID=UPI002DDC9F74|nr:hypothetical protein [Actinocrinis sp.]HEV3174093.1 hypothetical protein [Actinocrinis sp.]